MSVPAAEWLHPETPLFYEAFYEAHPRYRKANQVLIGQAGIEPAECVLDVAAGTGRTAEAALGHLGLEGRILCVEPSRAMRWAGKRRLTDSRVRWRAGMPPAPERFDRILCGAGIWQLPDFPWNLGRLAKRLRPGGALIFNIRSVSAGAGPARRR